MLPGDKFLGDMLDSPDGAEAFKANLFVIKELIKNTIPPGMIVPVLDGVRAR